MPTDHARTRRGLRYLVAGAAAAGLVAVMAFIPAFTWAGKGETAEAAPLTTIITLTFPDPGTPTSTPAAPPGLSFLGIFPQCSGGFLQGLTVLFGQFPAPPAAALPLSQEVAAVQTSGTGTQKAAVLASPRQVTSNSLFLPVVIPSLSSGSGVLLLGNSSDLTSLLALLASGGSLPSPGQLQGFSFNCGLPTLPPPPSLPAMGSGLAPPAAGASQNNGAASQYAVPTVPFAQTAQPVSYLGYAPTGGRSASGPVGLLPLVALGAAVLAAGSGLTVYRVRARANRSKG